MSKNNTFSRVPIHVQDPSLAKANSHKNPSYESFRPHQVHNVEYKYQGEDRPNTHMMSVMRRNPDGSLDYEWAKNMVVDAIHGMSFPHALRPIHHALLTVCFPDKYRGMMPQEADLKTQLSASEKARVRDMVEEHLLEEENWNVGGGGGSVAGRSKTRDGTP